MFESDMNKAFDDAAVAAADPSSAFVVSSATDEVTSQNKGSFIFLFRSFYINNNFAQTAVFRFVLALSIQTLSYRQWNIQIVIYQNYCIIIITVCFNFLNSHLQYLQAWY